MNEPKEIYSQRYETYRHLDKLRWQMMQIGIASGSIVLAFGDGSNGKPGSVTLGAVGAVLLLTGLAMLRIGNGIKANAEILSLAGKELGDDNIPILGSRWRSVSYLIAATMMLTGVGLLSTAIGIVACK